MGEQRLAHNKGYIIVISPISSVDKRGVNFARWMCEVMSAMSRPRAPLPDKSALMRSISEHHKDGQRITSVSESHTNAPLFLSLRGRFMAQQLQRECTQSQRQLRGPPVYTQLGERIRTLISLGEHLPADSMCCNKDKSDEPGFDQKH